MKLADMYFRQIGRVRVDHLFVGTNRDNMIDMAKRKGAGGSTLGEDNPRARLTDDQMREIRRQYRPRRK